MSKTLADCRSQTRMFLDESSAADWTAAEVDREINAGYQELVTAVMDVYEEFYVVNTSINTVADQQEYSSADSLPTGIFKIRRVEINYDTTNSNSVAQRALPISVDEVRRDLGNNVIGISVIRNPGYYILGLGSGSSGQRIGFIPVPTRNGTNAITIWYVPVQGDLSAATDRPNIPYEDRYAKLISLYAAGQLLRKGQQEEEVARQYLLEYQGGLEKMKQELEDRVADDTKGVVDTAFEDVDFSHPSTL